MNLEEQHDEQRGKHRLGTGLKILRSASIWITTTGIWFHDTLYCFGRLFNEEMNGKTVEAHEIRPSSAAFGLASVNFIPVFLLGT